MCDGPAAVQCIATATGSVVGQGSTQCGVVPCWGLRSCPQAGPAGSQPRRAGRAPCASRLAGPVDTGVVSSWLKGWPQRPSGPSGDSQPQALQSPGRLFSLRTSSEGVCGAN